MATFTGLGKSYNGGQTCETFTKFYFISPIPPCQQTSMYPNTMVLETIFVYLKSKKQKIQTSFSSTLMVI